MIDLYYWPTPNGDKVTLFLEEAGVDYTLKPVNIGKGDQFTPDFLQISPNNKMPVIVDHAPAGGDTPLSVFESGAILLYLAEKTGRFLPADARSRLVALEWLFWQVGGLGPMSGQMAHFSVYAQEKIPYAIDRYNAEVRRLHRVLDQRLAEHPFVAGAEYGIADMASYPWFEVYGDLKPDYDAFPHLKRWQSAIAARPAVQRAYALKDKINPNAGKPLSEEERQHMFGRR